MDIELFLSSGIQLATPDALCVNDHRKMRMEVGRTSGGHSAAAQV